MKNELLDLRNIPVDYYPTKEFFNAIAKQTNKTPNRAVLIPGMLARSDNFDVDDIIAKIETMIANGNTSLDKLLSRLLSVSDLTEKLYDRFSKNPNSMYNWFPALRDGLKAAKKNPVTDLKIPATKILRLPIEMAQFIRLVYADTNVKDRETFNDFIFRAFDLEDDKTYFIKTGNFSSKFQFANAKCSEPREMGEYFQVINNFAMEIFAGQTIDLVVREYIEDVEDNPTIYNGMPLRTEFRAFVDFDTNTVESIVPYWHPIVMKGVLSAGLSKAIQQDYRTYLSHEDKLLNEFNEHVGHVARELRKLIPYINLTGQYSIDVMKNGNDFYVIDMALAEDSALRELSAEYRAPSDN